MKKKRLNFRRIRNFFMKWYVQLLLIVVPMAFGICGYMDYYTYKPVDNAKPAIQDTAASGTAQDMTDAISNPAVTPAPDAPADAGANGETDKSAKKTEVETVWPGFWAFFSSMKMFLFTFDGKKTLDSYSNPCSLYLLMIAQIIAPWVTMHSIYKLLLPKLRPLFAQFKYWKWKGKLRKLMLIGCNEENTDIYDSAERDLAALVFCETNEEAGVLQEKGYAYALNDAERAIVKSIENTLKSAEKKCTIIINTHDEGKNLTLCRAAVACIKEKVGSKKREHDALAQREDEEARKKKLNIEKEIIALLERLRVVVLGGDQYQAVYEGLQQDALGILKYTNRAELAALNFVMDHPLTEFLTGKNADILEGDGCVAADAEFQVLLAGFGETNKQILKTYISTNQFIVKGEKIPQCKPIHYYIFDRKDLKQDKELGQTIDRYRVDFVHDLETGRLKEEDYLPQPPEPAIIDPKQIDTDQADFIRIVRNLCTKNPRSVNILVIAFEDDLANVDLAQRVMQAQREWGGDNLSVYARCKKEKNKQIAKALFNAGAYTLFGMEKLSLNVILHDRIEKMAMARNRAHYLMEARQNSFSKTPTHENELAIGAAYDWHTMDMRRRLSNLYDVLSLRMKLQLIGLDEQEKAENSLGLKSEEDYDQIYAPELRGANGKRKDLPVSKAEEFYHGSMRNNLAVQEHYRWNGYMLAQGFVPASIDEIKTKDKKQCFALRIHGNLTTFEGLFDFLDLTGKNVINYDFQVMDDAWKLLDGSGREIVRR